MSLIIFNFAGSNPTINNYKTMKRTILLFLSVMMTVIMTAGDVTPQQALQQAQKFLQQTPSGMKRSQAEVPQLKMVGRVSGLYVFNAEQNQGYVIVSNDDRTAPILGYSETGTLDPDNMPCNMRAWLQGYADEIAWLNEHNIQPTASQNPRRTASAVKAPIAPLVTAHWNQGAPYNNQVSGYYSAGNAVTGCVATAMAQVMYYTAKKAGLITSTTAAAMPEYTTESSYLVPGISAGETINWNQMRDTYTLSDTDAGATAVATLMRCCGVSLEMNYGDTDHGGSSANGADVAMALKSYFGYDATTQCADRSYYSYANWIELIYNELKQGRAVVYNGQSLGGGHAFVCDGYQGEDYFHINWGWGGMSDDYFKLSVLDPDAQGIGGSSSTEGYGFGQNAIVGIQLEGGTGTVLSNPNTVDLTLNSVSTDKATIAVGETANITFNITNNSAQDYDGEIGLKFIEKSLGDGKMFLIPAGATKDCVVEFKPSETGTYNITAYQPNGTGYYVGINESKFVTITVNAVGNPTTDNITLTGSLTVDNSTNTEGLNYDLYGKEVNGVLRVSNPDLVNDYSGTFQFDVYIYGSYETPVWRSAKKVLIPSSGYIDIPVAFSGNLGSKYDFTFIYQKNGGSSGWIDAGYYTIKSGITAYKSDGTYTVVAPTTSYSVPANAVAVDMSGAGVTTITKNSNPNTLYILGTSDAVPDGLTNVVKSDGTAYSASSIILTDGNDFYSPVDFTATNIEFTYDNDRWADGEKGWNTIMLPFDVTLVKAGETPIDWFRSSSDTGKQFWLKEFTGDDTTAPKVDFGFTDEMKANTPYIVAFPGNTWGAAYDLSTKTIKFIGQNTTVHKNGKVSSVTGGNYRFVGETKAVSTENIYCINAAGNQFVLKATGGSPAFRPFFKADMFDRTVTSLGIGNGGGTTGIETMSDVRSVMSDVWYDLQGRRVENPTKGVYIKNGRKVVIK